MLILCDGCERQTFGFVRNIQHDLERNPGVVLVPFFGDPLILGVMRDGVNNASKIDL